MTDKEFNKQLTKLQLKFNQGCDALKELNQLILVQKRNKSLIQFTNMVERKKHELQVFINTEYKKK